jgi:hypothetical protein
MPGKINFGFTTAKWMQGVIPYLCMNASVYNRKDTELHNSHMCTVYFLLQ